MPDYKAEGEINEILAAAKDAKDQVKRKAKKLPLTAIGVGVGIGSAALAAALMYANRDKSDED